MWTRSVDGLSLATMTDNDPRVAFLADRRIPFSCFGRTSPGMPQHWVDIDNRAAIRTSRRSCSPAGIPTSAISATPPRADGILSGSRVPRRHDRGGPPGDRDPDRHGTLDVDATVADLLRSPDRPTAVIAGSDVLAAACYARPAGPDCGSAWTSPSPASTEARISRLLTPTLTTVAMPLPRSPRVSSSASSVMPPEPPTIVAKSSPPPSSGGRASNRPLGSARCRAGGPGAGSRPGGRPPGRDPGCRCEPSRASPGCRETAPAVCAVV